MIKREPFGRWELVALLGLLALAAVTRMGWPGLTEFKADEGRLLTVALAMSRGELAMRGISSSVGFPNFPMSVWLYSLPLLLWRHPIAATLFTGLLATLAVGGTYWLARRYWGVHAAVAATLMYAVAPWAIIFSRKIWAQNLLPLFVVGWAIAAALAFVEGRRGWIVAHLICLAVAIQLHFAAIGLIPVTLLGLVFFRRRVDWRFVLLGGGLALLTTAPFFAYLWNRWRAEGGLPLTNGGAGAGFSLDSLRYTLTITLGDGVQALAGAAFAEGVWWRPVLIAVYLVWGLLVVGGIVWLAVEIGRRRSEPPVQAGFLWLAWLFLPPLVFLWFPTPVYIHYFIAVLPAPYLVAGVFFGRLTAWARPGLRSVAWLGLSLTAALQLAMLAATLGYVASQPLAGGFGVPLATKLAAADAAREQMRRTGAAEVLIAGDGSLPGRNDFAAEFEALLHDVPRRYVDLNREALFPAAASVVVLDLPRHDEPTSTRDVLAAAASDVTTFVVAGSDQVYTVLSLPPAAAPDPTVSLTEPALLANFVHILGHNRLGEGDAEVWDLLWRTADNPDPADYHFFNHLLDSDGSRVAQDDAAAFRGDQWRAGDTVLSRFRLPVTGELPDAWGVRVGMYRYPSMEAVPVLDEAANPAGDYLEFK
jgi:4-amino-4-deoxy-L-arabinose transferase-like glycosyltransferase